MIDNIRKEFYNLFMQKIIESIKVPFRKNFFIGILDMIFRIFSLALWLWVVKVLIMFVVDAVSGDYLASERAWWFAYSAMTFVMATLLAYVAVYDREY